MYTGSRDIALIYSLWPTPCHSYLVFGRSRFEAQVREPELHDVDGIRVSDWLIMQPRPGGMHKNETFLFLPFQG